jgi:hypothetical protein
METLPSLTASSRTVQSVSDFRGYNHNLVIDDNQFYDMRNLTLDEYPVLTQRQPRGTIKKLNKPNGLFSKNKIVYVDGTNLYYGDELIAQVTDSKKQFASMGAYILVWPDKIMYNTFDGTITKLENKTEFTGTVKIEKANISDSQQTTTDYTSYVRITATGIGKGFKQYDGVSISGISQEDLNATKVLWEVTDDSVLVIGSVEKTIEEQMTITLERKVPDMEFFTESENRLWGCSSKNHELYACKIGDPTNWNAFENLSTDSYAVTIGSDGDFTGAATYMGYVLFFKEDTIHTVMGNKPANYQVQGSKGRGIEKGSELSPVIVNETLYYKARTGIVAYQGTSATSIASDMGTVQYKDAVAGYLGNKYYCSMKQGEKYYLFCYDESKGMWTKEDETQVLFMATLGNNLYYIDAEGYLKTITGEDDENIQWEAISGEIMMAYNRKYLCKINIRATLEERATLEAWVQYDNEKTWTRVTTITARKHRAYDIPVMPRRCDRLRIKLSGRGKSWIYGIDKQFEMGSDVCVNMGRH